MRKVGVSIPTAVFIPPGVVHGYKAIGPGDNCLCVNLPNSLYRGPGRSQDVDEIRYENNPDSPFHDFDA